VLRLQVVGSAEAAGAGVAVGGLGVAQVFEMMEELGRAAKALFPAVRVAVQVGVLAVVAAA
jgi:hypothetical protein